MSLSTEYFNLSEYALFSFMNILVETISLWVLKNVQLK